MSQSNSAIYDYIVRELAPTEHEPCEASSRGHPSMRLKAGTTPEEVRAIASTQQAKVLGLCHLEVSSDKTV